MVASARQSGIFELVDDSLSTHKFIKRSELMMNEMCHVLTTYMTLTGLIQGFVLTVWL